MSESRNRTLLELSRKSFEGWVEADVREEFITPLLRLLGYEKNTDYDINRESQHLLSKPFLMIGSKKQQLDYALLVRRRTFWLLEAKRPDPARIPDEAVFQAHFYALHPEVSARFFGVCNGRELILYDVRQINQSYEPLLRLSAEELPSRFSELDELIGARSLVSLLRRRVLEDAKALLSAEVREEQLDQFSRELTQLLRDVRPTVRDNARAIRLQQSKEEDETISQFAEEGSPGQIAGVLFEFIWNRRDFDIASASYREKFARLDQSAQERQLQVLLQLLEQPLKTGHRFNVLWLILRMWSELPQQVTNLTREFLRDALRGFPARKDVRTSWKLEAILHRVTYKASFGSPELLALFEQTVSRNVSSMSDEELVRRTPSVWAERNGWVRDKVEESWQKLFRLPSEQIAEVIRQLEAEESVLDRDYGQEVASRTVAEGDLTWFANYDKPWDYMRSTLFSILLDEMDVVDQLLDDSDLIAIGQLLESVSPEYTVNHADVLWLRASVRRDRFQVETAISEEVRSRLPVDSMKDFLGRATVYRKGVSALESGLRVWGQAGAGYVELDAKLDLESQRVIVTGAKILE